MSRNNMRLPFRCSATTIAKRKNSGTGKFRVCELKLGHNGDHETVYCGKKFRWVNTQESK